jgi:uncharacterized repeat protein (TIGR01451 family)
MKLHKEGPTEALLNEPLSYKITIANTGGTELTNVLLTDILPAGLEHASRKDRLSWIIGSLAAGQTHTIDYKVTAVKLGRLCNKAIATAADGLKEEMENCVTVGTAKLSMTMTGPKRRYLTASAVYQIVLTNTGTLPFNDVVITNPIPERATLVRSSFGGQSDGKQVQWSLGTLEPGGIRTVEVELQAEAPAQICNQATVTTDRGVTEQAKFCTDFAGVPALSLEIHDSEDPVEVGGTTRYSITVRNPGTTPAGNVRIVAVVPMQMEVQRAAGDADNHKDGQKIVYDPLTLPANGQASYLIDVKATQPGDVRFKVELTADPLIAGPVQQEESTTIFAHTPTSRLKSKAAARMPSTPSKP